jgi:hypothetical protein
MKNLEPASLSTFYESEASCGCGQMYIYNLQSVCNRAASSHSISFLRKTEARDATLVVLGLTECPKSKKENTHDRILQRSIMSSTGKDPPNVHTFLFKKARVPDWRHF